MCRLIETMAPKKTDGILREPFTLRLDPALTELLRVAGARAHAPLYVLMEEALQEYLHGSTYQNRLARVSEAKLAIWEDDKRKTRPAFLKDVVDGKKGREN